MGRYYPPPESDSSPSFNKSHPLGHRARKLRSEGILTVRFEMPFAIWCEGCPKPTIIGQGVRFNAEKKKIGNYFSTAIWQFRMKHAACGGWIEIRTDPKATEYVVTDGAKRRDYGDERRDEEEGVLDEEERARRREDAMAGLEGKKDEEKAKKDSSQRVKELKEERDRFWKDPYEASRLVRKGFRRERKERVRETLKAEGLKSRMGLDIELLPETELDRKRAELVEFGEWRTDGPSVAFTKPLFPTDNASGATEIPETNHSKTKTKTKTKVQNKLSLGERLRYSTRAAVDPFAAAHLGGSAPDSGSQAAIVGIKKNADKAPVPPHPIARPSLGSPATQAQGLAQLVAYDSD
ncbi:DUF572-domain-containing protein [Myriangium duriaei CBS 260.36]|uniref:DUF572-domain-containing protein n=1 Tax=Myriangium duriaei CBS 260.36 TaxID=1168546 RepID=A0A9P4ISP1_9PEZI|nr:DUF572-domain-containing protein [Myriangium duriaei CBS 260.36]